MSVLPILIAACGSSEPEELVETCFAEYLDYDRLTDEDLSRLEEGRAAREKELIRAFAGAFEKDDFLSTDERDKLIALGASAETLSRFESDSPWIKRFAPYLATRWDRLDLPPEGREDIAARMGAFELAAVSATGRETIANGIAEAALNGEYDRFDEVDMGEAEGAALKILETGGFEVVDVFMREEVFFKLDGDVRLAVLDRAFSLARPGDRRWAATLKTVLAVWPHLAEYSKALQIVAVTGDENGLFIPRLKEMEDSYAPIVLALLEGRTDDIPELMAGNFFESLWDFTAEILLRRGGETDYRALSRLLTYAVSDRFIIQDHHGRSPNRFWRPKFFAELFAHIAAHGGETGRQALQALAEGRWPGDDAAARASPAVPKELSECAKNALTGAGSCALPAHPEYAPDDDWGSAR